MNVKKRLKALIVLKNSRLILSVTLVAIMVLSVSQWKQSPKTPLVQDRIEIGLRQVGDQLMRKHGDSETPIPPIKHLRSGAFQLNLPKPVALEPDHLAVIAFEVFDKTYFQSALIQVYSDQSEDMIYGFDLNTLNDEEVPCLGRTLPEGNYEVQLTVLDAGSSDNYIQAAIMGVAGFGLLIMLFSRFSTTEEQKGGSGLNVADLQLDIENSLLRYGQEQVTLTQKELRLSELLMRNAGQLVTRDYLIEEVWSKEGVVTGRSLDVFISRLRKKMAIHPGLRILNKHGQGYVLEIGE